MSVLDPEILRMICDFASKGVEMGEEDAEAMARDPVLSAEAQTQTLHPKT